MKKIAQKLKSWECHIDKTQNSRYDVIGDKFSKSVERIFSLIFLWIFVQSFVKIGHVETFRQSCERQTATNLTCLIRNKSKRTRHHTHFLLLDLLELPILSKHCTCRYELSIIVDVNLVNTVDAGNTFQSVISCVLFVTDLSDTTQIVFIKC